MPGLDDGVEARVGVRVRVNAIRFGRRLKGLAGLGLLRRRRNRGLNIDCTFAPANAHGDEYSGSETIHDLTKVSGMI